MQEVCIQAYTKECPLTESSASARGQASQPVLGYMYFCHQGLRISCFGNVGYHYSRRVCSSRGRDGRQACVCISRLMPLPYFNLIFGQCRPDPYLLGAKKCNVKPENCKSSPYLFRLMMELTTLLNARYRF